MTLKSNEVKFALLKKYAKLYSGVHLKESNMSNLQMMDFAVTDKRSTVAMLRGKGDGREQAWLKFEGKHEALMTQEELQAAFSKASRYHKVIDREVLIAKVKKTLLVALGIFVIVS